ncbi:MAG: DNA topoisomerase (ATP-hydrolyzing) subunit B [bacterium]|nr:DNA topoisomerase (ATP-hydrolyzing) subunit B [bacterium]
MPPKKPIKKTPATKKKLKAGSASTQAYSAEQITVLEGLDPVRKRPGMYIGSTGARGLHHLIWEVVDNGIDEAMAGHATRVTVRLLPDDHIQVLDNGRGIPVDPHPQFKTSALELVLTKLHAGGKFGGGGYKVSGGLHGVGVSVVNALSTYLRAEVLREKQLWVQEYSIGKPRAKVKAVGKAPLPHTATAITFHPDGSIFETTQFDYPTIVDHLRQQAYLTKGIEIVIEDLRTEDVVAKALMESAFDPAAARRVPAARTYTFHFEGGIASFVGYLNANRETSHDVTFYVEQEHDDINVEVALQYTKDMKEHVMAFANNITNPDGGTHVQGFRTALTRTLNAYARAKGMLKEKDENLSGDDVREGLTAIVSVKVKDPQFEGQTKGKLGNPEVQTAVGTAFGDAFAAFLEEHPRDAEAIISRCALSAQARRAAKIARETVLRKGALEGLTLPGKLADCSARDPKNSEIFIVEGDSAGGSAKSGRDRETQAILPLRGKILNVERARLDKMLANNEIKSLIIALGTNIGEQFELDKLRYDRIIIATDADVDGAHIRTLLLTLFWRYFPALITSGHLYIAQPPLYKVTVGRESRYAYSDAEKERVIADLNAQRTARGAARRGAPAAEEQEEQHEEGEKVEATEVTTEGRASIQRYKGLGEMNPEQLWETTMDPARRVLKRVTVDDAQRADSVFDILMGASVEPRKKFIQTHAKAVKNLDI